MGSNLPLDNTAGTHKPPWEALSIHAAKKVIFYLVSKHIL